MSLEQKQLQQADVVAVAADLMFASRLRGAAEAAGVTLVLARTMAELPERVRALRPRLVLVDLDARAGHAPAAIREVVGKSGAGGGVGVGDTGAGGRGEGDAPRLVAYASHMDGDAIRAARDAGAREVLARSAFVRRLPELLAPK